MMSSVETWAGSGPVHFASGGGVETSSERIIAGYRLLEKIGRGSMGVVFRAVPLEGGEPVAIKLLPEELAKDAELVERFRREASSAAQLEHPNITRVLGFGNEGRDLFMVMELLDGADLATQVASGQAGDLRTKLSTMTQVASGMAFVHHRGVVHRDLKPANIHVKPGGVAKIMDFGLVRLSDSEMTRTGMVMGSPAYMAPEQIRGNRADACSDVFSLGAVFYELLTARRAFAGKGLAQVMMAVVNAQPERLASAAPGVPAPLARIVERCLCKLPAERYQTAGELHAALEVAQQVYAG
jgi:serine/threonine-protein kinase